MSNYNIGDKVVLTVTDKDENGFYPIYVLNDNFYISEQGVDEHTEPLTSYTETLEAKINRQAKEITRLFAENKELKEENKKLFCKVDSYELYGDQHEEEYNQAFNQGAEAAWELVRKIGNMPYDAAEEAFGIDSIFDLVRDYTYQEAAAKVVEWKKAKEEIKVGDVVRAKCDASIEFCITKIDYSGCLYGVGRDGETYSGRNPENWEKTDRHTDIDNFLKQIRGAK